MSCLKKPTVPYRAQCGGDIEQVTSADGSRPRRGTVLRHGGRSPTARSGSFGASHRARARETNMHPMRLGVSDKLRSRQLLAARAPGRCRIGSVNEYSRPPSRSGRNLSFAMPTTPRLRVELGDPPLTRDPLHRGGAASRWKMASVLASIRDAPGVEHGKPIRQAAPQTAEVVADGSSRELYLMLGSSSGDGPKPPPLRWGHTRPVGWGSSDHDLTVGALKAHRDTLHAAADPPDIWCGVAVALTALSPRSLDLSLHQL